MNSKDKINIGKSIRTIRKSSGFTQKELSQECAVKQSTISRWENGVDQPSIANMTALVGLFNCSYDELIGIKASDDVEEIKMINLYRNLSMNEKSKLMKFIEEIL